MDGIVFDIKEFAVFDGPGIRTTVFMKGCPLRCAWCHNPEGLSPEPELMVSRAMCAHCGACKRVCETPGRCTACGRCIPYCKAGLRKLTGQRWTADALAARLQKDSDVYASSGGGVTFSGGEPLLQWPFVREVIARLRGVHTAIETSGYASDEIFQDTMSLCDLIMLDWKVSDPEAHARWTGVRQDAIRRHLEDLAAGDTPFILRMPIIPGVNDTPAHFDTAAELVKHAHALVRVDLLPYQRAAGAKYVMVNRPYQPAFDEARAPLMDAEPFERRGIPVRVFR